MCRSERSHVFFFLFRKMIFFDCYTQPCVMPTIAFQIVYYRYFNFSVQLTNGVLASSGAITGSISIETCPMNSVRYFNGKKHRVRECVS